MINPLQLDNNSDDNRLFVKLIVTIDHKKVTYNYPKVAFTVSLSPHLTSSSAPVLYCTVLYYTVIISTATKTFANIAYYTFTLNMVATTQGLRGC